MNKRFSFITVLFLLICLIATSGCGNTEAPADDTNVTSTEVEPQDTEPILTFAVMSDSHIGDANTEESMRRTLRYLHEYGGKLDAFMFSGDLTDTTGSEPIDSYSLTGFKGSTVYKVFDEVYPAGEYLVEITCPNPDEGVGVYYYQMDDERDDAYLSYENGSEMEQHIYFSWTNSKTCSNPYVPIN